MRPMPTMMLLLSLALCSAAAPAAAWPHATAFPGARMLAAQQDPQEGDETALTLLYGKGRDAAQRGDVALGIAHLSRVLEQDPTHLGALNWRGHCHNAAGMYELALKDYLNAIQLVPTNPGSQYGRATALRHLGRYLEAVLAYGRAIDAQPDLVDALNWRGYTLNLLGRPREALRDFTASVSIVKDDPWTWFVRGKARSSLRDYDGAIQDWGRAIELRPDYGDALLEIGFAVAVSATRASAAGDPRALAIDLLRRGIAADGAATGNAQLWIWMLRREAAREAGSEEAGSADAGRADEELRAFASTEVVGYDPDSWQRALARLIQGEGDAAKLLERGFNSDRKSTRRGLISEHRQCQLHFFRAVQQLVAGEARAALDFLLRSLETLEYACWEWEAARLRLLEVAERHALSPDLGMRLKSAHEGYARRHGLEVDECRVVESVRGAGFAARAGIRPGDVILKLNQHPASDAGFRKALEGARPGDLLSLKVLRSGERMSVELVLGLKL